MELEVEYNDGKIEIVPKALDIRLVQRGEYVVMEAKTDTPLTSETVEKTLTDLRENRLDR